LERSSPTRCARSPNEVGLGAGLLAIEHARSDRDRVLHEAGGIVAGGLTLTREANRAGVVDDEGVDDESITLGADLWTTEWSSSFHWTSGRYEHDRTEKAGASTLRS